MLSNAMKNPEVNPVVSFSNNDIDKERAARNAEYLAMLDKSLKEIEEGKKRGKKLLWEERGM